MSESVLVSVDELIAYTGVKTPRAQAEYLSNRDVKYSLRRNGEVIVRRSELERLDRRMREWTESTERQQEAQARAGALAAAAMFLVHEEIVALCGLKRHSLQAKWLAEHGYRFHKRVDGSIALRRAEVDYQTLSRPVRPSVRPPEEGPRLGAALDSPRRR